MPGPEDIARRWRERRVAQARRDVELETFPTTSGSRALLAHPMFGAGRGQSPQAPTVPIAEFPGETITLTAGSHTDEPVEFNTQLGTPARYGFGTYTVPGGLPATTLPGYYDLHVRPAGSGSAVVKLGGTTVDSVDGGDRAAVPLGVLAVGTVPVIEASGTLTSIRATFQLVDRAEIEVGILISGEAGVLAFDGGSNVWSYNDESASWDWWTAVDVNGGTVAAVRYDPGTAASLSLTGDETWTTAIASGDGVDAVAGADGSVYVITEGPCRVYKYNSSGTEQWNREFSTGSNDGTNARLAVSATGEVAAIWSGPDNTVSMLNTDGTVKWEVELDVLVPPPEPGDALAGEGSILVDGSGDVIFGSSDKTVRKLSGTNGTLVWERELSGSGGFGNYVYGLAFHGGGLVAGQGTSVFYLDASGAITGSVDVGHGIIRVASDGVDVFALDQGGGSGGTLTVVSGGSVSSTFDHGNPFANGLAVLL